MVACELKFPFELHLADFGPLPVTSAELLRAWQLKTRWEWLEGRFRIERGDPWSTLRFESSQGSFQTSTLRPESFGIREGETYRVQVRFV
ncbi:MAG: hypothetical protein JSR82_20015 [Verrucomicrobia bacterium]|nr:hypothetical protein [Verrucomicrobiota bacterium]